MAANTAKKKTFKKFSPVYDDYQVENDLRTLVSSKEIMADKDRMMKCKELAKEKMAAMGKVMGGM